MITCPLCRRQYSENAHYCKYDGALLINHNQESIIPAQAYPGLRSCGRCLAYYPGHFIFCPIHGTALDARPTTSEVEPPRSPALQGTSELKSPRLTKPFSAAKEVKAEESDQHLSSSDGQESPPDLNAHDVPTLLRKKPSKTDATHTRRDALAHFLYTNADTTTSDRNRLLLVSCVIIVLITALFVYSQFSAKSNQVVSQTPRSNSASKESAGTGPQSSNKSGLEPNQRSGVSSPKAKNQQGTRSGKKLRVKPGR